MASSPPPFLPQAFSLEGSVSARYESAKKFFDGSVETFRAPFYDYGLPPFFPSKVFEILAIFSF